MFMTNYELVYGKRKFSSDASNPPAPAEYHSTPVIQSEESVIAESSKTGFMQSAVGFMKSDDTKQKLGSLAGKLKNAACVAAGVASGLAKSAVETAKSEETAAKLASLKEKAQSAAGGISASVSGLGNKASEAIASRKHSASDEVDFSETDMAHTEEYLESTVQEEPVYTDDFSETSSQENYAPDEEYEADEYIEEYEDASDETKEEIPVYNEAPKETYHSQTVYTKTHDNTYSNTYDQANSAPTQEKSNKKPVIIGIAAGLGVCAVFAGGLFGGMYLMKNKDDTPNNDNVVTESTTESHNPQTSFNSDINDYPLYLERLQLIAQNLGHNNYDYGCGLSIAYKYSDTEFGYSLQDLNADGIPELITTAGEMSDGASSVAEIYAISTNQLVMLCQTWDRSWYYMCENNVIAFSSYGGVTYNKYIGGSELETIDSYSWGFYGGAGNYNINGNRVSDDEIQQLENKYKSITIDTMPLPNVSSSTNQNTAPIPTITAEIERRPVMVDFDGDGTLDFADGNDYYLNVSGDYAYYLYEYYETYPGEETLELIWSETISEPSVYLTSGSGGFSVIVYVTPYNSDGVAGTTVICE